MFNENYVQTPELLDDFTQWWQKVVPQIIDRIKHTNLKLLNEGLDSVSEGLELSRNINSLLKRLYLEFWVCDYD